MATTSLPCQLVRTRRFTLGDPERVTVSPDGTTVLFLRGRAGDDPVTCLWTLDPASGAERVLADLGDPIDGYATDATASLVVCTAAGALWAVRDGDVRRLPTAGPVTGPRPDPAGTRIAYVSDGTLRVIEADGTGDRALAVPDGPDVTFGVPDLTGAASLGGEHAHWWAGDGGQLLVVRVDSARVPLWYTADPARPDRPPRPYRYAAVGTPVPEVSLWLVDPAGARTEARWDHAALPYLVGAGWDEHGPYAVVRSRDQRTVRFLAVDPATGATSVLAEQRDECWVQLIPGLPARTASGAVVTHVDRQGTRYLAVAGRTVTPPGLQVRSVLDVTGEDVLFTASGEPTETHLWHYRPGDGPRGLSVGAGVHSGARGGSTLVRIARRWDRPGARITVTRDGKPAGEIASLVARPVLDVHATHLVLGPRSLRAVLYLPSWHRDGDRLPVLLDPYGGAGRQRATRELDWRCLVSQWFAEQGCAVLVADGAGTPGRGPDWEREVHGELFAPVLADQVAALHEAAREHPDLNLGRVGIRGWSFGGSLAAAAVLRRPDVVHVAVAGAGVTDQSLYNAHWRERFLGHPDEFPERYAACSLVAEAPRLTRPLLLTHGLADTNVHPANTLRLSDALLAAARDHEVLLLPGVGHQAMGVPGTEHLLAHQARFLARHLGMTRPVR